MVAPHRHLLDVRDGRTRLGRQLRDGAVVVEPHHRGETRLGDVGGRVHGDHGVGVRRIADDEDLDVVGRAVVDGLALRPEDPAVGLEEIGSLHSLGARARAHKQGDVRPVERVVNAVVDIDGLKKRESRIVELHGSALRGLHCLRNFQQVEAHRRVGAEQRARSDAEEEGIADVSGGARNGDGNWRTNHQVSFVWIHSSRS